MLYQVSVVIPVYSDIELLQRSVRSAISQQCSANFEIFVVSDASIEPVEQFLRKRFPAPMNAGFTRYMRLSKNGGPAAARNFAVRNCATPFIAFLDFDDEWLPGYLERQLLQFSNPAIAFSATDCVHFEGEEIEILRSAVDPRYASAIEHMLFRPFIQSMSQVVIRRDVFLEFGGLDESLRIPHDRDLYLRILGSGRYQYAHVPEALVNKVTRPGGSVSRQFDRWSEEVIRVAEKFLDSPAGLPFIARREEIFESWRAHIARIKGAR